MLIKDFDKLNSEDWYEGVDVIINNWNTYRGQLEVYGKDGINTLELYSCADYDNINIIQELKDTQFWKLYWVEGDQVNYNKFVFDASKPIYKHYDFSKDLTKEQVIEIFNDSYVMTTEHTLDEQNCNLKFAIENAIKLLNNSISKETLNNKFDKLFIKEDNNIYAGRSNGKTLAAGKKLGMLELYDELVQDFGERKEYIVK